nr:uncharacterized protein LOC109429099 [Aedes albopictus]
MRRIFTLLPPRLKSNRRTPKKKLSRTTRIFAACSASRGWTQILERSASSGNQSGTWKPWLLRPGDTECLNAHSMPTSIISTTTTDFFEFDHKRVAMVPTTKTTAAAANDTAKGPTRKAKSQSEAWDYDKWSMYASHASGNERFPMGRGRRNGPLPPAPLHACVTV